MIQLYMVSKINSDTLLPENQYLSFFGDVLALDILISALPHQPSSALDLISSNRTLSIWILILVLFSESA